MTDHTVMALSPVTTVTGNEWMYVDNGADARMSAAQMAAYASLILTGVAKITFFSRDMTLASGNVTYTGIGFTPSLILFMGILPSLGASFGVDIGTSPRAYVDALGGNWQTTGANSIFLSGDYNNIQEARVASFNSDGFVLTWTKTLLPTGTGFVSAICFK